MDFRKKLVSIRRELSLTEEEQKLAHSLELEYSYWVKQLSAKEIHAIKKYTKNSLDKNKDDKFYQRLNKMLSSNNPTSFTDYKILMQYADIISNAIRKHKTEQSITVYRGSSIIPIENVEVGENFIYNQFISTSLFREYAFKLNYLIIIHIPVGINASYIDSISSFKGQYEILIDRGYQYSLISIQGNVYELEVFQ